MNSRRKLSNLIICVGLIFIVASILLSSYNMYDETRAARSVNEIKEVLIAEIPGYDHKSIVEYIAEPYIETEHEELPLYVLNPEMKMPTVTVSTFECIGILNIPLLNLELPVIGDWSYSNLRLAPCRYSGSAYDGNFVICAHNYEEHFGNIQKLTEGDEIIFTDAEGNNFYYEVEFIDILQPTDTEDMVSEDYDLTLFTCNFTGQIRITVRCRQK